MATDRHSNVVIGFPENLEPAAAFADQLGCPFAEAELHRFPDGESRLRIVPPRASTVVLYRSLDKPNDKLVELLLCVRHLRECAVRSIVLIAPYLCYMRQDKAFRDGEVVSQRWIGQWLASLVDGLVTVDPHLHRTPTLDQVVPGVACRVVSAAPLAGRLARTWFDEPLLLGPDEESRQWLAQAAKGQPPLEFAVARKRRGGDHRVDIEMPEVVLAGRDVVLIDDIASTATTLSSCAQKARAAGARAVTAIVTHALFATDTAIPANCTALDDFASTDSVPHPSNRISLATDLAQACRELLRGRLRPRSGQSESA